MDLSIGEVARLTGLPVKTIRYYSDIGLVPAASRTGAGYRRYDEAGLAGLELIRALRDLGVDLASIRQITERQMSIEHVASAHADAIDLHIQQLTLRRAVLRAIARGVARPEEVQRMTAFASASAGEARRIMEEFLDSIFAEHPNDPFAERMRTSLPVLPDLPTAEQIDAWMELAGLVQDSEFRARVGEMVADGARLRAASGSGGTDDAAQRAGQAVVERAGTAVAKGIATDSAEATAIVNEVVPLFAAAARSVDSPEYRIELAHQIARFSDPRVERYWQLIGLINGWPVRPSLIQPYEWFMAALKASVSPRA
jgi:DNA-binding transcriptional MerR regulator